MITPDREFYLWAYEECVKDTYEGWGTDMMSKYENVKKDFPNAAIAIGKMYENLNDGDVYDAQPRTFEGVNYVYEAIAKLIPQNSELRFDTRTKEQSPEYNDLNMCSWNKFVPISRIDLLMAVLLFTEEFILNPVTGRNVILTENKLTVYGSFVTFKVSKHKDKTYVSIRIRGIMLLEYVIVN